MVYRTFSQVKSFSRAIELLGGHRAYCSYSLPLQTTVESKVVIFLVPSHFTHSFKPSDEGIFGPLNIYFKNEAAACEITRCLTARLIGFAWGTFASVGGCVSDFESKRLYPFNSSREPEYSFSIKDASESINSMETAPPSMAIVCVISMSVTMSQILLLFSPELLSTPLSTIVSSGTPLKKLLLPDF